MEKAILKNKFEDYTKQEFLVFLQMINTAIEDEPDNVLVPLMELFEKITEHPSGSDLFFRPQGSNRGEPEQVLEIVETWRLANGKLGFKAN